MHKTGNEIKQIINRYKDALRKLGVHADKIILYGSYARGKQHAGSDIDLVVVSDDFQKMNLRERLEILGIAAARIMKPIEAKGYTAEEIKRPSPASFIHEVLSVGVVV